jgi:hypothetical protein
MRTVCSTPYDVLGVFTFIVAGGARRYTVPIGRGWTEPQGGAGFTDCKGLPKPFGGPLTSPGFLALCLE